MLSLSYLLHFRHKKSTPFYRCASLWIFINDFNKTGNYLPKRTVFVSHRLSFTHSRYAKGIFYGKCWLFSREHFFFHRHCSGLWKTGKCAVFEKRRLLPSSSFLAGLAGNRGGEVWRGGTAQTAGFIKWAHCPLGSPAIVPYCAAACGTVPAP